MEEVNLKSIAKELGISISTVSRALRDHPDIKASTKKAVIELAEKLEYEPNQLAYQLLKRRSNTIGVVLPKIHYPLYAQAISGIEEVAEKMGFQILLCQSNENYENEIRQINSLLVSRVSGVIISVTNTTKKYDHLKKVQNKNIPLVLFNRDCEELTCSRVIIDNRKAAYKAVKYLIEKGSKKIAYIGGPANLQISQIRLDGYRDALKEDNLEETIGFVRHVDFSRAAMDSEIIELLSSDKIPDAIITYSDQIAQLVLFHAKKLGIKIPEQLKIIGFNNEPVNELLEPSLSSIAQPAYSMGKMAAELVFKELESTRFAYEKIVLESELVKKGTA
ncbi:MAG: LacI family DNA-binding transcriptional regulator [Cyclobacteriaceae bacterium]